MFNFRLAKDLLLHTLKAKNRHGLHSPFVYRVVDTVIYDFHAKIVYPPIEKRRAGLLADARSITLTNPVTGAYRQKKISLVAAETLKPAKLDQMLYRLAAFFKPDKIVEIGACPGITTLYLRQAVTDAAIYAWEEDAETFDIAQDTFKKAAIDDINLITGKYEKVMPRLINALDKLDFVLIGSDLQKVTILKYFELCLPKTYDKTVLIFYGIYQNEDMKQAWAAIKAHPKVTVTVDLFWMGLVFFKQGQEREDFLIRFLQKM